MIDYICGTIGACVVISPTKFEFSNHILPSEWYSGYTMMKPSCLVALVDYINVFTVELFTWNAKSWVSA